MIIKLFLIAVCFLLDGVAGAIYFVLNFGEQDNLYFSFK